MWPGNSCTFGTSIELRRAAAVPHTPLPTAMRTHAGLPWNGPSTSSPPLHEIESGPIEIGQRVPDQRRDIGRVGDRVTLTLEKPLRLAQQLLVDFGFASARFFDCEHERILFAKSSRENEKSTHLFPPRAFAGEVSSRR